MGLGGLRFVRSDRGSTAAVTLWARQENAETGWTTLCLAKLTQIDDLDGQITTA